MKEIIDAAKNTKIEKPDVLLVYDSFQAGAMPADKWYGRVLWSYYFGTKQIESAMRMMGVNIPVKSPDQARSNLSYVFGSYGVTGNMAWNTTNKDIKIEMANGEKVVIPKHGWTTVRCP